MTCIPDLYLENHLIEKDIPEEIIKIINEELDKININK